MDHNPVFAEYLRAGLFEIGDSDERLAQLGAAVTDLTSRLTNDLPAVRCYTLAALDANLPLDNAELLATQEIVRQHWKALAGKYPEPPRGILRGVMLSALYALGQEYAVPCRIIYYTAGGLGQFISFNREQAIIDRLLREFGKDVEDEALAAWSLAEQPTAPAVGKLKLPGLTSTAVTLDKAVLTAGLKKAIGPEENGYASYHNNTTYHDYWTKHFAENAGTSITSAVDSALQKVGQSLSTQAIETEINKFFTGVSTALTKAFTQSFQSLQAVEQRSRLLWWKETQYSLTLRRGYREVPAVVLPVVLALDLLALLPDVVPVSVDYLLLDTYRLLAGGPPKKQPLAELLAAFAEPANQQLLAPHLTPLTDCGSRTTLTAFLAQVVHGRTSTRKLSDHTGLRAKEPAASDQLAVLVLHDLLTERLIRTSHAA